MRDQYAGDVSDAVKFALLRKLAGFDRRLGVAWYYVPGNDGRPDGRHIEWLDEESWATIDPALQQAIRELPSRDIASLEGATFWPEATKFYREPVPVGSGRYAWARNLAEALLDADLIFLDPDNGIGNAGIKHATWDELRNLAAIDRCIAFIKFPGRTSHLDQLDRLHNEVRDATGLDRVLTVRTSVAVPASRPGAYVPRARWFTFVNPDDALIERAKEFADTINRQRRMSAYIHV